MEIPSRANEKQFLVNSQMYFFAEGISETKEKCFRLRHENDYDKKNKTIPTLSKQQLTFNELRLSK